VRLLLDTHIWLWAHLEPARLGAKVRAALTAATTELWLSPITVWEVLLLADKGRIAIAVDPQAWIDAAWAKAPMHEATLNREVAARSRVVKVPHEDPADRFLAATAEVYDLTLVTSDVHLLRGKGYRTLANR
jgi:PIN domain nuclease of toxin-antitoxin system